MNPPICFLKLMPFTLDAPLYAYRFTLPQSENVPAEPFAHKQRSQLCRSKTSGGVPSIYDWKYHRVRSRKQKELLRVSSGAQIASDCQVGLAQVCFVVLPKAFDLLGPLAKAYTCHALVNAEVS